MATLESPKSTKYSNVTDRTHYDDGADISTLKKYDDLSENARLLFDPLPFNSIGNITYTTNRELSTAIRQFYGNTFHDLVGVNILLGSPTGMPNINFNLQFFFQKNTAPCPENKIENLCDLTSLNGENGLYARQQIIQNKASGKKYTLNKKTRLLLGDIMYGGNKNKDNNPEKEVRWDKFISTRNQPTLNPMYGNRAFEMIICVGGCFDIHRVLKKIYGNKMVVRTQTKRGSDGKLETTNILAEEVQYKIALNGFSPTDPNVFNINVEQFDANAVRELTAQSIPRMPNGAGPVFW